MLIVIYIYESLIKQIIYTTYFLEILSKVFFYLKSLHFNHKVLNKLKIHFCISSMLVQQCFKCVSFLFLLFSKSFYFFNKYYNFYKSHSKYQIQFILLYCGNPRGSLRSSFFPPNKPDQTGVVAATSNVAFVFQIYAMNMKIIFVLDSYDV